MKVQVQRLTSVHDRTKFKCGEAELDKWLETQALQQQTRDTSRTFVLVDEANPTVVLGFYALTISQADGSSVPIRSQPKIVPVIRLACLAVREDLQGTSDRFGEFLLLQAIEQAVEISDAGAGVAVAVDAKHDNAASFYMKYGFQVSPDNPLVLYLPMSVCRQFVKAT
jgi:ribosomal protein S18 acetylase RimI-like enzyme